MFSSVQSSWDFAPVYGLLQAFSSTHDSPSVPSSQEETLTSLNNHESDHDLSELPLDSSSEATNSKLGDFGDLWKFLGVPPTPSAPIVIPTANNADDTIKGTKTDVLTPRGVRWQDQHLQSPKKDPLSPSKPPAGGSRKTQLRAARRLRAAARAEGKEVGIAGLANATAVPHSSSESSSESDSDFPSRPLRTTDRRSIVHSLLYGSSPEEKGALTTPSTSVSPPKPSFIQPKEKTWPVSQPFLSPARKPEIKPLDGLDSYERRSRLITKLMSRHINEEYFLNNASLHDPAFYKLNVSNEGIHVFVDISNIMIGFHDALKASRDIPIETRIRRVYLSFHNLSIILERGRPAAKRILAGSDRSPEVYDASQLAYQTNILDRVFKAKELTPRQRKYQLAASAGGASSGSETTAATHAPTKWVEQGVDEILHLKILESLIDSDKASTIVLVTGDAAEAEYSDGFFKMVERALVKGWSIELVSFKRGTSLEYRKKQFREKWGAQFKCIFLDDYCEDLLLD